LDSIVSDLFFFISRMTPEDDCLLPSRFVMNEIFSRLSINLFHVFS
jgi:hypothetical protein